MKKLKFEIKKNAKAFEQELTEALEFPKSLPEAPPRSQIYVTASENLAPEEEDDAFSFAATVDGYVTDERKNGAYVKSFKINCRKSAITGLWSVGVSVNMCFPYTPEAATAPVQDFE